MGSTIAIVGAGPRGAGLLERLAASAPELHPEPLTVHLIDPYPAGAGRIWRHDQSSLLAMNSMAADVTMYTDESVVCAGPVRPGPSFWDWARHEREHGDPDALGPELATELRAVTASTFPSRRLQSAYLDRVLRDVIAGLPRGMRVQLHRTVATGLAEDGATQLVTLADGSEVARDVLFIAAPVTPRDASFAHLSLERNEAGLLAVDAFGRTSVEAIYAAGDLVSAAPAVVQALATGQRAAVGVTFDLTAG